MIQITPLLMVVLFTSNICYCLGEDKPVTPETISGTWSRTEILADGSQVSLLKIITPTHFAVFQQDAAGKNRQLFQAHSGRYSLQEDVMIEEYLFSSDPRIVGRSGKCRITLEGETLKQTWPLPDGSTSVEVWKPQQSPEQNRD